MIYYLAVTDIEGGYLIHILLIEFEIPNVKVLLDTILMNGFRDNHNTSVDISAECDLCGCFAVFCAYFAEYRVSEDVVFSLGKRSPCLRLNAKFLHCGKGVRLLEERVEFHLIYHRCYFAVEAKVGKSCRVEVANADSLYFSLFIKLLHCSPCAVVIAKSLMNEIEVEIVNAELFIDLSKACFAAS